ncbi:MAG: hypothetical protein QHH18_07325 [Candidatus Bathyarchaeota archaeon]|nr:hypothetical protein [Candidatus Bathyarchaeota archaeon A05DMB-5]MDH7558392.1 hypothetical protein [Candidatus Bathyarchaeota archaeon]
MVTFEGKCPSCGKVYYSKCKGDIIVCDCRCHCPLCGAEMTQYMPDTASNIYGIDNKQDLRILMVCTFHNPPFFSTQKPTEVVCT